MAAVATNGMRFALLLSEREFNEAGFEPEKEYEFKRIKNGIWIVVEKEGNNLKDLKEQKGTAKEQIPAAQVKEIKDAREISKEEKKIIALIREKQPRDRVEGWFEKLLNPEELKKFREMLKSGRIVRFRLDKKYKKAIYKLKEEAEKDVKKIGGKIETEATPEENNLIAGGTDFDKDGFAAFYDEQSAKRFSETHREEMKANNIMGIKTFDNAYYFMRTWLFKEKFAPLLEYLGKKKSGSQLAEMGKTEKDRLRVKIMIEFLKEEGLVIEKRKEFYEAV